MEIVPYKSLGIVSFGDSRREVRAKLGEKYSSFAKSAELPLVDEFEDLGLHVHYDKLYNVEFLEAFEPASVSFDGVLFLGRKVQSVIDEMRERGFRASEANGGIDFNDAGIGLTYGESLIEAVAVFRRGYYDE